MRETTDGTQELELVADRNLDDEIKLLTDKAGFDHHVLYGAESVPVSDAAVITETHRDFYNIPIVSRGETLGMMVFYIPGGTERRDENVAFLRRVADTLALVITLNRQAAELSEKVTELDYQKLALDEHAIVSVTDIKGNITYANDKFCSISGYSREELIGANHRLLKSDEHSPQFYRELWRTIASGKVWNGEIKNRKKRGGHYWVTSTIVPFLNADGKPFQYVAIRTDITAEKKKELELARAHDAAEAANTAKSEFLATMSHEIRTPMTGVIGFADLLLQEELDGKSKDLVHKIKSSTRSLLRIINDILDISKLDAGKVEFEYIDFHLPSLIGDVVDFFSNDLYDDAAGSVRIETDIPDNLPCGINLDPTRLRQVLINLVGNARKFTEAGTITVKCRLTGESTNDPRLYFSIRDTGIGIRPEVLGTLFSEFKQGDASITRKFEGTGLGLAICKKLVTLMNGDIGAASEYGKGSTFWFSLPYTPATTSVSPRDENDMPSAHFTARRPLHILVVDDNAMNQQIVTAILKSFGHTYETADHGLEAIEMHEAGDFDLILMDVRMPVMCGPDATRMIRKMPGTKGAIPIIALTADAIEENRKGFYESGMDAVVIKPIDIGLLASTINMALGERVNVPVKKEKAVCQNKTDPDATSSEHTAAAVNDFLQQIGVAPGASNDEAPAVNRKLM
ncbi:MAG: ATP-binding protein [Rhodospirillales bacterium]